MFYFQVLYSDITAEKFHPVLYPKVSQIVDYSIEQYTE